MFRSSRRSRDSCGQEGKCIFLFTHHQTIRFRTHPATTVSSPTYVEPSALFFFSGSRSLLPRRVSACVGETRINVETHFFVSNAR